MIMIALNEKYLVSIQQICEDVFNVSGIRVILFGSRARGDARESSDIDLAVISNLPVEKKIRSFRDQLQESTIPYRFDVVEFRDISDAFKEKIEKEGIDIWKN